MDCLYFINLILFLPHREHEGASSRCWTSEAHVWTSTVCSNGKALAASVLHVRPPTAKLSSYISVRELLLWLSNNLVCSEPPVSSDQTFYSALQYSKEKVWSDIFMRSDSCSCNIYLRFTLTFLVRKAQETVRSCCALAIRLPTATVKIPDWQQVH